MNKEAWKLLKCVNREEGVDNNMGGLEDVICLDVGSCAILTPLEQLINFLTNVDKRLKLINQDVFLESMLNIATDEAMLLHMHHGLQAVCDQDVSDEDEEQAPKPKEEEKKDDSFGSYYDVRIKTHWSGSNRCVIFVFTNVSAEKDLQRELVMKQYSQIMFTSINHELRTPINGKWPLVSKLFMQLYKTASSV